MRPGGSPGNPESDPAPAPPCQLDTLGSSLRFGSMMDPTA